MVDVILIPWRRVAGARERNLQVVLDWYRPMGLKVSLGDSIWKRPFNRGAARNAAAINAGQWDRALIADADCLADPAVVLAAMDRASETGKLILPHDSFTAFTRRGTEEFLQRLDYYRQNPGKAFGCGAWPRLGKGLAPSGALVVTHDSFDAIGGYDEGFNGWGFEDTALLEDAERTVGVERLPGYLWHLWHPTSRGTMVEVRKNSIRFRERHK